MKLYQKLASLAQARANCVVHGNSEWFERHSDELSRLVKKYMPSGSGFDSGTGIDLNASNADKLTFSTAFHHMDENGMYCGWTEYTVTVLGSLAHGLTLDIECTSDGRDADEQDDITDYIAETFRYDLEQALPDADTSADQIGAFSGLSHAELVAAYQACRARSAKLEEALQRIAEHFVAPGQVPAFASAILAKEATP